MKSHAFNPLNSTEAHITKMSGSFISQPGMFDRGRGESPASYNGRVNETPGNSNKIWLRDHTKYGNYQETPSHAPPGPPRGSDE